MNGLIVLAAAVCTSSAQVYAPGLAIPASAPSHQFHAQDEFGQFSFGHAGGPSARTEARNAYGVTTGSYQYLDANGLIQTVNYIADDVNGFRVQGTNLPVAPVAQGALPVAPVFTGVQAPAPVFSGVQIADTADVIEAKAAFATAYAAQEAAVAAAATAPAERKRRSAQVLAAGLPYATHAGLGLPFAGAYAGLPFAGAYAGLPFAGAYAGHGLLAAAPGAIVADIAHATPEVIAAPALTYAHAAAVPVAAAAPSREAVLTTVKLNPGHAVFYRVD